MLVSDPELIPQHQKLLLPMRQSPGAKQIKSGSGVGGRKQTRDRSSDDTGGLRRQVDEESRNGSGNHSDPERLVLLNYAC